MRDDAIQARHRARLGSAVYFGVLIPGTAVCEGVLIAAHRQLEGLWVLALMWTPALASLVARLVLRESVRDVSFRLGGKRGWRAIGKAWLYPIVVGSLAYGVAWASGLAHFAPPAYAPLDKLPPLIRFARAFGIITTLGVAISALSAAGEEIGWRGYMLTRLVDAGVPRPVLVSGVIWAVWHMPLIFSGVYASGPSPTLSAALFAVTVVPCGYLAARLRLDSGSVWPAVMLHAAWNAVIQSIFDAFTSDAGSPWVGESGVLVALASVLAVAAWTRGRWGVRRWPADDESPLEHP